MLVTLLLTAAPQMPLAFDRILAPGAGLVQPVGLNALPGDDRIFVTELPGRVRILRGGALEAQPFLDVAGVVAATGLSGLRGIAFHPGYASSGQVYLWYDAPGGGNGVDLVLARMLRDPQDPNRADPNSLVELLREPQDVRGHGGGALHFGPDGMLWVGLGDGALPGDMNCRAQDRSNLLGSILRLDVDGAFPYAIPADNPFVGQPGSRGEIAHHGLRHPWKWSFDRSTGDLWIADVGEFEREEVDFVRAGTLGKNFGWNTEEGSRCNPAANCGGPPCGAADYVRPIFEYGHDDGCSITGGFVYRGSDLPELDGAYVCMDFCTGRGWTLRYDGANLTESVERSVELRPAGATLPSPVAFGEDGDGELLVLDHTTGGIFRMGAPCGATTLCAGAINVTGRGATLRASGTPSLSANAFGFLVSGLPPGSSSALFYGTEAVATPLGNGLLCVGGGSHGLVRTGLGTAGASGTLLYPLDLNAPPLGGGPSSVSPCSTRHFQAWYRDVGGPLGASSNVSSAATVRFCD